MKTRTNYKKKQITGKEIHSIISIEAYKALQKHKDFLQIKNTTKILEILLLNAQQKHIAQKNNSSDSSKENNIEKRIENNLKKLVYITNLINFNQKLYIDLNATFSNINQIAYKLNLLDLNGNLKETNTKEFYEETIIELNKTRRNLIDLRVMMKNVLKNLRQKNTTIRSKNAK
ncbi:MAG: hypothetical protein IJ950_04605 [Helicobacter sp.]|nr:hypothetical protein [Helicobacter sp.]